MNRKGITAIALGDFNGIKSSNFIRSGQNANSPSPKTTRMHIGRRIALIPMFLLAWFISADNQVYGAWDYGDGRHGSFILTTNATIEQLYQTVRLPTDPEQYNPASLLAVPHFQNLTITNGATLTANGWSGGTGGRIVLKVQATLSIATGAAISVNGGGYDGGIERQQGESYIGSQAVYPLSGGGAPANYGGGGAGSSATFRYLYPGGGGGYGSEGGDGTNFNGSTILVGGHGGGAYGSAALDVIFLGSGGGGGVSSGSGSGQTINGGRGGGAILLHSGSLQLLGQIQANGGDGATGGGGGGGGSGGSILLRVASATLGNNLVTAIGGSGGQSGGGFTGSGGNGGVGRIRLEYAQNLFGTTSPDASKVRDIASDNASVIATQPADVTCFPKATATFNVGVTGLPQLQFQWYFNSVPVAGATNQTLVLSNLNLSQSGNYSVSISNAVMTVTSSQAVLTVLDDRDSDGDGIPNYWELQYGLDPLNKADALSHPVVNGVTNQLTYLEIYRTGLNPTNGTDMLAHPVVNGVTNRLTYLQIYQFGLDPSKLDYDGDGLTDYDEIFVYGTDPKNPDTDGDGIPDGVEVQYGMNPRVNDANESKSFDGVTNLQKYQWNLVHTNAWEQMFPNRVFSGTNTVSDYERYNPGMRYSRPVYDGNDRLIGVEYSSGVSLAYVYDGNGNLIRQKWISRASETNSLPALFTFLNNLTNSIGTGPYDDPDGDGWTNLQEQRAGTNPNDPLSKPDTAFNPGTNIASLQLPFTPRNFVMAVGQLDGLGTEEIVIGADGNPGTNTNYILILSQTFSGWSTQKVDIGSFGVTSISIGQPTNRPSAGIYLGLRQAGGTGRVWELMSSNGIWITTEIAISSDEATFVNGVREQNDVLVSQAINGLSGALFGLKCMDGLWTSTPLSTNTSHRGFGNQFRTSRAQELTTRLLDGGGIEVSYSRLLPALLANAVNRPDTSAWYLLSPVGSWQDAQAYALQMSGNLTTIKDDSENRWLGRTFSSSDLWIGLFRLPDTDKSNPTSWHWISGDQSSYRAWGANEPNDSGGPNIELYVQMTSSGFAWNDARNDHISPGIVEVINDDHLNFVKIDGATVPGRLFPLAGPTMSAGFPHFDRSGGISLICGFVEDNNSSGRIDSGDDFVITEYTLLGSNVTTNAVQRVAISGARSSQCFAIALVSFNALQPDVLFTGEPDGRIYFWKTSTPTGPLQRQIFSDHHLGMDWHALNGLKLSEPGDGLIGLRVDPTYPSACSVFFWPPQQTMAPPPTISQTAPGVAIMPSPSVGGSLSQVVLRLWDNEGNASLPMLEFQVPGSSVWSNATILTVDSLPVARVAALPTGSDHTLVWNAALDLGSSFTNTVLLRARASDVTLTGDYSATMSYHVEIFAGNPIANPDATNTFQALSVDINVLANDTVQNGRTFSIVSYTQPANGTTTLNANQTIRYMPNASFIGADRFSYTISDGTGGTNIAVVTVTVLPVNHPPTPQSYAFTTAEDTPVAFAWNNDRDVDGDLVTLFSVRSPSAAGGTVTMQSGVITYTPATNFFGTDTFTFIVQDNGFTGGQSDPKQATNTVTITVTPVNDSPVITLVTNRFVVNEDVPLLFTGVSVSDPDAATGLMLANLAVTNGILTLGTTNGVILQAGCTNGTSNLVFQATLADLNAALTNLVFQGATNFNGTDRLLITVNDQGNTGAGGPLTATNVVFLSINPVNDLPIAAITNLTNGQVFLTKDKILIQADVRDLDGQIMSVDFLAGTTLIGTLTNAPYTATFTNPPAVTNLALTVRATDDQGGVGISPVVNITVRVPGLILLSQPVVSPSRSVQLMLNNPDFGRQFRLEFSVDLKSWTAIGQALNTNGTLQFTHSIPANEVRRFYRAILVTQ